AAGRVLVRRHAVQQLGSIALNQAGQRFHTQAVVLDWHADDSCAPCAEGLQSAEEAGLLDQHRVARGHEHLGGEIDALLAAAGHAHQAGIDVQSALLQQVSDGLAEWRKAWGGADLQGLRTLHFQTVRERLPTRLHRRQLESSNAGGERYKPWVADQPQQVFGRIWRGRAWWTRKWWQCATCFEWRQRVFFCSEGRCGDKGASTHLTP